MGDQQVAQSAHEGTNAAHVAVCLFSVVFTTALTMWSASVGALTLRQQLLPLKVRIFALLLYVQKFLCIALSFGFPS